MMTRKRKHGDSRSDAGTTPNPCCDEASIGRGLIGVVVGFLLLALCAPARAQGDVNSEYRVKLAFLYNFAMFVEWPADAFPDPGSPLVICVAGNNPFQGEIEESLQGRRVGGRSVKVAKLHPGEDSRACQIIFVRATQKKEASRIFTD